MNTVTCLNLVGESKVQAHEIILYPCCNVHGSNCDFMYQGTTTAGYCRYRQAIPPGRGGGRLDIDANFGIRRAFLPQV